MLKNTAIEVVIMQHYIIQANHALCVGVLILANLGCIVWDISVSHIRQFVGSTIWFIWRKSGRECSLYLSAFEIN